MNDPGTIPCFIDIRRIADIESVPHCDRRLFLRREAQRIVSTLLEARVVSPALIPFPTESLDHLLIAHEEDGKPYLAFSDSFSDAVWRIPWNITVSHSGAWIAVGLSPLPTLCGVDIERLTDRAVRVYKRFATAEEIALIDRSDHLLPQKLLIHLIWSAKETAYKIFRPQDGNLRRRFVLTQILPNTIDLYTPTNSGREAFAAPLERGALVMNCIPDTDTPAVTLLVRYDYTDAYVLTWATLSVDLTR